MEALLRLYRHHYGRIPARTEKITGSGSNRAYYRFFNDDGQCVIACHGTSVRENRAFITLACHFAAQGIPVPAIIATDESGECYLQENVGERSLFDALKSGRENGGKYDDREKELITKSMRLLPHIQVEGARGLDFSVCYPVESFDRMGILFDLNYFKYCFLKTSDADFDEYRLEYDFQNFADDLMHVAPVTGTLPTFLYRDFQARNIMLDNEGHLSLIDFQGGRRGPLQYDVVSFLWQASSHFPDSLRKECIETYLDELSTICPTDKEAFRHSMPLFVLFRLLQVLGAYGFRGRYERKQHFLDSIPPALDNLRQVLPHCPYSYLHDTCLQLFI